MNKHQRIQRALMVAVFGATSGLATQVKAQSYRITHVDPSPSAGGSWAWDINNEGRVTGAFAFADFSSVHGFYWDDGVTMDLPPYTDGNTRYCEAFGVNADGIVVGEASKVVFPSISTHGFITTDGVAPNLLDPLPAMRTFQLNDVNDTSVPWAVGWTDSGVIFGGTLMHQAAALLLDGNQNTPVDLDMLGGRSSWANAINVHGAVAGGSLTGDGPQHAALWLDGLATDLGTLGGRASEAVDLNDDNLVVGWAETPSNHRHAMAYVDGTTIDLGTLQGHTSEARGVNGLGQIVGMSWTAGGRVHAFVYEYGSMADLNALVSPGSGWELQYAEAINDLGQIVGRGRLNGKDAAFLLTPEDTCFADCNGDGTVDTQDFICFLSLWTAQDKASDCNGDGLVNTIDFVCFLNAWATGC